MPQRSFQFIRSWKDYLYATAWAVLLAALLVDAVNGFWADTRLGYDSSIFAYVGEGLAQGELPYRDRWDHKGPLTYLFHAVPYWTGLGPVYGQRLLQTPVLLASLWLLWRLCRAHWSNERLPALTALAAFLGGFALTVTGGSRTEDYALPFQMAALFLALAPPLASETNGRKAIARLLAIGALGGLAFLLRPNLIGPWLILPAFWLIEDRRSAPRSMLWAGVGGATVLGLAVAAFAAAGALRDLLEATILFNMAYTNFAPERAGSALLFYAQKYWLLSCFALLAGGLAWMRRKEDRIARLTLLLLPVSLSLAAMTGRIYDHYYMVMLPPLALLLGLAAHTLRQWLGAWTAPALLTALTLLFAPSLAPALNPANMAEASGQNRVALENLERLGAYLDRRSTPGDTVQTLSPHIYHFTERPAPTRFIHTVWSLVPSPMLPRYAAEFIGEIRHRPPRFILEGRSNKLRPPASRWTSEHDFPPGQDPPTLLKPYFDFVDRRYAMVCRFDTLNIYELKPAQTRPADCPVSQPLSWR